LHPALPQVLVAEVKRGVDEAISGLHQALQADLRSIKEMLAAATAGGFSLPAALPAALASFWRDNVGSSPASPWSSFLKYVRSSIGKDAVQRANARLAKRCAAVSAAGGQQAAVGGDPLAQLLQLSFDPNGDGHVSTDEFYCFYLEARDLGAPRDADLPACVDAVVDAGDIALLLPEEQAAVARLAAALAPQSFDAEIAQLMTRFLPDSRRWLFEEVDAWLALPPGAPDARAFLLYGGPGIGKSTFSATLLQRRGGDAVAAHHFCKFSDERRRAAIPALRSIAFQLARSLPELRPDYAALTADAVDALTDVREAFKMLLALPLAAAAARGALPASVVVLVDALDEAEDARGDNALLRVVRTRIALPVGRRLGTARSRCPAFPSP